MLVRQVPRRTGLPRPLMGVVYLEPADKGDEPTRSRQRVVNTAVICPLIGRIGPCKALFPSLRAHLAPSALRSLSDHAAYSPAGCRHGGTRNSSTSRNVQTWSVSSAAMAGVLGRHRLAEPLPWVGSGWSKGKRKLAWGKQKL
jgi:hypothetical protein